MVERNTFLANPKHQYHVSLWGEHDCHAYNKKEWRLFRASKFVSIDKRTLILRKMVEGKGFPTKPKHQYHVSQ